MTANGPVRLIAQPPDPQLTVLRVFFEADVDAARGIYTSPWSLFAATPAEAGTSVPSGDSSLQRGQPSPERDDGLRIDVESPGRTDRFYGSWFATSGDMINIVTGALPRRGSTRVIAHLLVTPEARRIRVFANEKLEQDLRRPRHDPEVGVLLDVSSEPHRLGVRVVDPERAGSQVSVHVDATPGQYGNDPVLVASNLREACWSVLSPFDLRRDAPFAVIVSDAFFATTFRLPK